VIKAEKKKKVEKKEKTVVISQFGESKGIQTGYNAVN